MVRVYISNVSNLPDPNENLWIMEGLPEERKNKILRFLQAQDRRQNLAAGLLLKYVLEQHEIDVSNISYGPHGKPELPDIYFNLSHSHDYVVCAVSDKPVGCDIEKIGKSRDGVAERFFTKAEWAYLNTFEDEVRLDAFYRIWTMKESYLKMTGEGLAFGLNRIECRFEKAAASEAKNQDEVRIYRDGEKCHCFIKEYKISGYKLSVCAEEKIFASEVEEISK